MVASLEVDLEASALKLVVEIGGPGFLPPGVPNDLQGLKELESAGNGFRETL